jgi:threonine/homoserine/homoserine lactone efflux protein
MKILGAAYMVYLVIKTFVPSKAHEIKNNNGSFLIGALLQLINQCQQVKVHQSTV